MSATGISDFTAAPAIKRRIYEDALYVFQDDTNVDVAYGFAWPPTTDDWVSVEEVQAAVDPVGIGPRRQQDETVTVTVSVGSYRSGNDSATEIEAAERAWSLLRCLWEYIRTEDITLGGNALWCVPGDCTSAGATDEGDAGYGRVTEINAQFVARHRIRSES